ncbi:hypothetical protein B0A48_07359 [Cryoendolithus antarcticus]|uniref:DUF7707 domain-containing protein n=1 Tax=Cryoendolithus antarcticus TaxID=1507870 RepID=A0A1V8T8Z8_9PEZI|nr:hypothetical protein B0A48_07359 [Cryoendolithus antarcticus]
MYTSATLLAVAAFATSTFAQSTENTTGTSLTINTGSVDSVVPSPNTCDPTTLQYSCTCTNGNMPNISNYDQTVPSFICTEYIKECVASHPNDLQGITNCRSIVCGKANVSALALGGDGSSSSSGSSGMASMTSMASGSASSAAASATSGASSAASSASSAASSVAGSASSAAASATSSASAALMNVAADYGTGVLAAAFLAVFGLAL